MIPLGVSNRHVHLPGDKADELGVGNGDFCKIRIGGLKGTVFENVLVRVNDTWKPHVHLSESALCTDTVNAQPGDIVLTCGSSSARSTAATREACTDNAIIAIVDIISTRKKDVYRKG